MDMEREKQRQTYQICRLGFGILSLALILATIPEVLLLLQLFFWPGVMGWFAQTSFYRWLDVPIIWGSLVGAYLLWGRWAESGWQKRAGLLLLMCSIDVLNWFLDHGEQLNLRLHEVGHEWLRTEIGGALGWAEFALIASLACDLLAHLGVTQATDAGKATRSLAATGAVVWLISFIDQTAWAQGWPLQRRGIMNLQSYMLFLGTRMIWTITLIQVTALTVATARQLSRVLSEMDQEDQDHDLFKSPSDQDYGLLVSSREDGSRDNESTAYSW